MFSALTTSIASSSSTSSPKKPANSPPPPSSSSHRTASLIDFSIFDDVNSLPPSSLPTSPNSLMDSHAMQMQFHNDNGNNNNQNQNHYMSSHHINMNDVHAVNHNTSSSSPVSPVVISSNNKVIHDNGNHSHDAADGNGNVHKMADDFSFLSIPSSSPSSSSILSNASSPSSASQSLPQLSSSSSSTSTSSSSSSSFSSSHNPLSSLVSLTSSILSSFTSSASSPSSPPSSSSSLSSTSPSSPSSSLYGPAASLYFNSLPLKKQLSRLKSYITTLDSAIFDNKTLLVRSIKRRPSALSNFSHSINQHRTMYHMEEVRVLEETLHIQMGIFDNSDAISKQYIVALQEKKAEVNSVVDEGNDKMLANGNNKNENLQVSPSFFLSPRSLCLSIPTIPPLLQQRKELETRWKELRTEYSLLTRKTTQEESVDRTVRIASVMDKFQQYYHKESDNHPNPHSPSAPPPPTESPFPQDIKGEYGACRIYEYEFSKFIFDERSKEGRIVNRWMELMEKEVDNYSVTTPTPSNNTLSSPIPLSHDIIQYFLSKFEIKFSADYSLPPSSRLPLRLLLQRCLFPRLWRTLQHVSYDREGLREKEENWTIQCEWLRAVPMEQLGITKNFQVTGEQIKGYREMKEREKEKQREKMVAEFNVSMSSSPSSSSSSSSSSSTDPQKLFDFSSVNPNFSPSTPPKENKNQNDKTHNPISDSDQEIFSKLFAEAEGGKGKESLSSSAATDASTSATTSLASLSSSSFSSSSSLTHQRSPSTSSTSLPSSSTRSMSIASAASSSPNGDHLFGDLDPIQMDGDEEGNGHGNGLDNHHTDVVQNNSNNISIDTKSSSSTSSLLLPSPSPSPSFSSPSIHSCRPFHRPIDLLDDFSQLRSPLDMLQCLLSVSKSVYEAAQEAAAVSQYWKDKEVEMDVSPPDVQVDGEGSKGKSKSKSAEPMGADSFFPIYLYVIIHSDIPDIHFRMKLMQIYGVNAASKDNIGEFGEHSYYLTCLESAMHFIDNADPENF